MDCFSTFPPISIFPDLEINYLPNLKFVGSVILTETIGFISVDYCIDNEYYSTLQGYGRRKKELLDGPLRLADAAGQGHMRSLQFREHLPSFSDETVGIIPALSLHRLQLLL